MLISAASYQIHRTSSWLQPQKDLGLKKQLRQAFLLLQGIWNKGLYLLWAVFLTEGWPQKLWEGDGAWWTFWESGTGVGVPRKHMMSTDLHVMWVMPEWLQVVYPTWHLAVGVLVFLIGRARWIDGWGACKLGSMWAFQRESCRSHGTTRVPVSMSRPCVLVHRVNITFLVVWEA